jgi:hypothetical protein
MKIRIIAVLLVFFVVNSIHAQIYSDSLLLNINKTVKDLQGENENLKSRLEIQSRSLNDISKTQHLSDHTKWDKIKMNVTKGIETYKILSDDIIDLKSQVINQDYQGFIKKLSSVKDGPLGFSFDQVILKVAESKAVFSKKAKNERFMNTLKALSGSPLVALVPFASQAVTLSSSALNVAYAAGLQDKKVKFEAIKAFEKELDRYVTYYTTLDKANILNTASSSQTIGQMEALQLDLLDKMKKDAFKLDFRPRDQRTNESIDDYCNYLVSELNTDFIKKRIVEIESKYTKDNKLNLGDLLQTELDIRHVNNNLDYSQDLGNRFIGIYDGYFDSETRYFESVKNAINVAKTNGIIEAVGEKTSANVYDELVKELLQKKSKKDNSIRSSVNIKELKEKMESVDIYKIL